MSKALKKVENEQKVFSILQTQIDNQRQQAETAQLMLYEIQSVRDEVNSTKAAISKDFEEMKEMVQEVRDSARLTDAECTMIHSEVATKSNKLAKDRFNEEEGEFMKVVGFYRRMVWKKLKEKYDVPKYNCIRRIDFNEARVFVQNFRPESYL